MSSFISIPESDFFPYLESFLLVCKLFVQFPNKLTSLQEPIYKLKVQKTFKTNGKIDPYSSPPVDRRPFHRAPGLPEIGWKPPGIKSTASFPCVRGSHPQCHATHPPSALSPPPAMPPCLPAFNPSPICHLFPPPGRSLTPTCPVAPSCWIPTHSWRACCSDTPAPRFPRRHPALLRTRGALHFPHPRGPSCFQCARSCVCPVSHELASSLRAETLLFLSVSLAAPSRLWSREGAE